MLHKIVFSSAIFSPSSLGSYHLLCHAAIQSAVQSVIQSVTDAHQVVTHFKMDFMQEFLHFLWVKCLYRTNYLLWGMLCYVREKGEKAGRRNPLCNINANR